MALIVMLLRMTGAFLLIIGICTTVAIILFIVSAVMKHKNKKAYLVPRIIGWIFIMPLVITVILGVFLSLQQM